MGAQGDDEVFVGKGSFRIDRSRALEKLMRFQLPNAWMYPLPWIQAAVASGASQIFVNAPFSGFELAFHGQSWDPEDIQDPYRHLFEEDPDGGKTRYRELAVGLLSVLRLNPEHVSVMFGYNGKEFALNVKSVTEERLETLAGWPLKDMSMKHGSRVNLSIWVQLSADSRLHRGEAQYLKDYCRRCPIPIAFAGTDLTVRSKEPDTLIRRRFSQDGVEGELALRHQWMENSRLELVIRGVRVATEHPRLPGAQADGYVRDDAFKKSLSQMGVVKETRYQAALRRAGAESVELLRDCITWSWKLAPAVVPCLRAGNGHNLWMPWIGASFGENLKDLLIPHGDIGTSEARLPEDWPALLSPAASRVYWMSVLAATLRHACLRLRDDMLAGKGGVPDMLWNAPVLFDTRGMPLTLKTITDVSRCLGHVPYLDGSPPRPTGSLATAWIVRPPDLQFLQAFFPGEDTVRRLTDEALASWSETEVSGPKLEEENLLVRLSFRAGDVIGEAGLSVAPHTKLSRIRWLSGGRPLGRTVWPLHGLRLEAVLDDHRLSGSPRPEGPEAAQAVADTLARVPELYREAAAKYDPMVDVPQHAMLREHLLDFFFFCWDAASQSCGEHAWLESLPLFREADGRILSLADIRAAADAGSKPTLLSSSHPPKLRELVTGFPEHAWGIFAGSPLVEAIKPISPPPPKTEEAPAKKVVVPVPKKEEQPIPQISKGQPEAPKESPVQDMAPDRAAVLKKWLKALKNTGACPLPDDAVEHVCFRETEGAPLVQFQGGSEWGLNLAHPLVKAIASQRGLDTVIPYLVSVYCTGVNRIQRDVTDAEDARLTEALVDIALQTYLSEPGRRTR
ncbi:MAG: hypothetical protein WC728_00895 [Elusimicrobiota bacterium]